MFVSQDTKCNKKRFIKPNILRKKPLQNKSLVVHKVDKPKACESCNEQSVLNSSLVFDLKSRKIAGPSCTNESYGNHVYSMDKSANKTDNSTPTLSNVHKVQENNYTLNSFVYVNNIHQGDAELSQNKTVNSDIIIKGNIVNQDFPVDRGIQQKTDAQNHVQKWCISLLNDPVIKHVNKTEPGVIGYVEQKSDIPLISDLKQSVQQELQKDTAIPVENNHTISIEQLIKISTRFKCDVPECNKDFMSKQKLNRHIANAHSKDKLEKPQRQISIECPVKRTLETGIEEQCGIIFHVREELMKHLNEEHTIDEALYSCAECGRRFFWASGLRAHARSHAVRARRSELACPWPGCERVFRQPCRLREHARAHTGDRPYPCRYPNCGWSFRTASKLLRHARRHTGERRHACGACGRAFLRREHLRDHARRHHAEPRRALHACPRDDCKRNFTNLSALYLHLKKFHKDETYAPTALAAFDQQEKRKVLAENMFVVGLMEPTESAEIEHATVEGDWVLQEEADLGEVTELDKITQLEELGGMGGVGEAGGEEAHAARTHCTWPLPRALHFQPSAYLLEEDVQVEQSEGSESNIYTVRSDLFLHGNVLHSEDSEQMADCAHVSEVAGEVEGETEPGAALDADLLLDAPSVHLDQEELYTDAVDESSFRVLLLNGEELT